MDCTFEWGEGTATLLSVLRIVPRHCAQLTYFLHPKVRKINAVLRLRWACGAQEALPNVLKMSQCCGLWRVHTIRTVVFCLHPDMAKHGALSGTFANDPDPPKEHILKMLMKSSDLNNVTKPFPVAKRWAEAVVDEFWAQGVLCEACLWCPVMQLTGRALCGWWGTRRKCG